MKARQTVWTEAAGWTGDSPSDAADLVLAFGSREALARDSLMAEVGDQHPNALIMGCSTAGEIGGTTVHDDSLVVTSVEFEQTTVQSCQRIVEHADSTFAVARELAEALDPTDLRHVFVLSDGLTVNGSQLVSGISNHLPEGVSVTGGLAGDADRFERTLVLGESGAQPGAVVACGLYGDALRVGFGSLGGWDAFGPSRRVTRSKGNELFELDGQSALELYKRYLGEHAEGLPGTGLLYPLSLTLQEGDRAVVRTILGLDEKEGSLTFAGDIPEGASAKLMKANFDRLIDGAEGAARGTVESLSGGNAQLAILISCVGRKLVLGQRIEEEVEAVRDVLGPETVLSGFYSYGEISPFTPEAKCELHNQTMTITTFRE